VTEPLTLEVGKFYWTRGSDGLPPMLAQVIGDRGDSYSYPFMVQYEVDHYGRPHPWQGSVKRNGVYDVDAKGYALDLVRLATDEEVRRAMRPVVVRPEPVTTLDDWEQPFTPGDE
jgi:hypothetical protein